MVGVVTAVDNQQSASEPATHTRTAKAVLQQYVAEYAPGVKGALDAIYTVTRDVSNALAERGAEYGSLSHLDAMRNAITIQQEMMEGLASGVPVEPKGGYTIDPLSIGASVDILARMLKTENPNKNNATGMLLNDNEARLRLTRAYKTINKAFVFLSEEFKKNSIGSDELTWLNIDNKDASDDRKKAFENQTYKERLALFCSTEGEKVADLAATLRAVALKSEAFSFSEPGLAQNGPTEVSVNKKFLNDVADYYDKLNQALYGLSEGRPLTDEEKFTVSNYP